jgi:hypothetical protein
MASNITTTQDLIDALKLLNQPTRTVRVLNEGDEVDIIGGVTISSTTGDVLISIDLPTS